MRLTRCAARCEYRRGHRDQVGGTAVDLPVGNDVLLTRAIAAHAQAVQNLQAVEKMAGKKLACAITKHMLMSAVEQHEKVLSWHQHLQLFAAWTAYHYVSVWHPRVSSCYCRHAQLFACYSCARALVDYRIELEM